MVFAQKNKPEKILIIANKLDTSMEMANKVRGFTEQWPDWVGISFSKEKNSQSLIKRIFLGNTQTNTEIAIKSYQIHKEELEYIGYDDRLPKTIKLTLLDNSPKKYIKKKTFYFGTDKYGRDLLSRLLIGTRISFFIGFIAVFISLFIGIGNGCTEAACNPMIADSYSGLDFNSKLNRFHMWFPGGIVIGSLISKFIVFIQPTFV